MTPEQWENLCDRCGLCCLVKLIDDNDPEERVHFTNVCCRLMDTATGLCQNYSQRKAHVPECIVLRPDNLADHVPHLPPSCAYKRLYEHKPLPEWHPLVTGQSHSVRNAGISVAGRVVSETNVPDDGLESHIMDPQP